MKKCIVNFTHLEQERYKLGFNRLKKTLVNNFDGDFLHFHDCKEIGSPEHSEVPYAFKPYAIKKAIELGYELILWADCPIYAIKPINKLFNHIEENGYLFFDNIGFSIGDYTSDKCLMKNNILRTESYKAKMIMACCMGFNMQNEKTKILFDKYFEAAKDGISYLGSWTNKNYEVSLDLKCKGHRHDQSVISILINKMNLDIHTGHETYFAYNNHPAMQPLADSVCLLSQGF